MRCSLTVDGSLVSRKWVARGKPMRCLGGAQGSRMGCPLGSPWIIRGMPVGNRSGVSDLLCLMGIASCIS